MIRVWIELLPGGEALRKKTLARFDVWNTSDLSPVSNYAWQAEILEMGGVVRQRAGTVEGHVRDHGGISLVRKVLAKADRPPTDSRVSVDEKIVDLSSHLLMLAMTVETTSTDPRALEMAAKAREALERSAK